MYFFANENAGNVHEVAKFTQTEEVLTQATKVGKSERVLLAHAVRKPPELMPT